MKDKIIAKLVETGRYQNADIVNYANYVEKLRTEKKKDGKFKNYWATQKPFDYFVGVFIKVANEGLVLDGEHITLGSTGISYDYVAYKNKMLLVYPESTIDMQMVYKGEHFEYAKKDGKVFYNHVVKDAFAERLDTNVVGGYCVIKNKRGEFITLLTQADFEKHRKVAKTDAIWKSWLIEMYYKTLIKKAVKYHFNDIYQDMDEEDNATNYDIENPLDLSLELKAKIDALETVEEARKFYAENKGQGKSFDEYITKKVNELKQQENEQESTITDDGNGTAKDDSTQGDRAGDGGVVTDTTESNDSEQCTSDSDERQGS